jgi:hypothetical protein
VHYHIKWIKETSVWFKCSTAEFGYKFKQFFGPKCFFLFHIGSRLNKRYCYNEHDGPIEFVITEFDCTLTFAWHYVQRKRKVWDLCVDVCVVKNSTQRNNATFRNSWLVLWQNFLLMITSWTAATKLLQVIMKLYEEVYNY